MDNTQENRSLLPEPADGSRPEVSPTPTVPGRLDGLNATTGFRASLDEAITEKFKPDTRQLDASVDASRPARPRPRPNTDTIVIPNAGRMEPVQRSGQAGGSVIDKAGYRRWLANKSREDLIDMLLKLDDQKPDAENTEKIEKAHHDDPASDLSENYQVPGDLAYIRLPALRRTSVLEPSPTWRIVLVSLELDGKPLGLLIDGEITVGRAIGDAIPDLDLTSFDARRKGVSRIHARLRPSVNHLTLVDVDSSNGTFWNRLRLSPHAEQSLKDGDVIAFGKVNFLVKVVKAPNFLEPRTLI